MSENNNVFTEDVSKARPFRRDYLESVLGVAESAAEELKQKREEYISPSKLKTNRAQYLSDFKKILGNPLFDRSKQNEMKKMFVGMDSRGYIYRLVFEFEKGIKFCGLLFVPFDAKGQLPLVTAIHGGDGTPELMSDMYGKNYYGGITGRLLARNVVVFAPQLLIWEGRSYGDVFDRVQIDSRFKALGSSLTTFECECIMGAIDKLCCMDFIDCERIGIAGLSYGGYYSIVTAILDQRIKAVYSACVFNDRIKNSRFDFVYGNMAEKFLDAEMTALVAPRPLYIEAGKNDGIFKADGAISEYERLLPYYSDCPEKLKFKATDTGHKYDDSDEGIEFLINSI